MNRAEVTSDDLRMLRDKYERMLSLRNAHMRARNDPEYIEPDPRPEMARLANRYPGALREIDRLPLDVIASRIAALAIAVGNPARAEPWMIAQSIFHRLARGALVTKRWLAGRKSITSSLRSAFDEALFPDDAEVKLFANDLDRVANPPRGRLMDLVHAKVAESLGVTEAEARRLVFDEPEKPSPAKPRP